MTEKMPPRERAPSKSRAEKSRPSTAAAAGTAVVPGRPPEAERGDWVIGDIIAELLSRVTDECAEADRARLRVPFAVGQARVALLQMVRWRFLVRDEGDTDPAADGTWREDEEPEPCTGDSWAWGSVPTLGDRPCLRPDEGEVSGTRTPCRYGRQAHSVAAEAGAPSAQPLRASRVPDTDTDTSTGTDVPAPGLSRPELLPDVTAAAPRRPQGPRSRTPLPVPSAPCPSSSSAKLPRRPERGRRLPRSSPGDAEGSSTEGCIRKAPPPSPPRGSLETVRPGWTPNSSGTVPAVPRLRPSQRPERWIRPQVEVLDPAAEDKGLPCPQGAPQGARWRSQGSDLGSSQLPRGLVTTGGARLHLSPLRSSQHPSTLPQQFVSPLDSVWLAPGVTIRWGGRVKHRCCIPAHGKEEEEKTGETKRDLRPIGPTVPLLVTAARQVTGDGKR